MLDDVVDVLACPHCGGALALNGRSLRCPRDHAFDIARQGYVSLLGGRGRAGGDTAAMVAERAAFLDAGHYAPIAEKIADTVRDEGRVLDVGAGTGYYLAQVLNRNPSSTGLALDVSKYACRRAAKAHPRVGAAVADAWQSLPVRTRSVSTVLNVFAPRNAAEMGRVLRPEGTLVVVTPNPEHLSGLVSELGLLSVDENKQARLDAQLGVLFEPAGQHRVEFTMRLSADEVRAVVAMGPSAWHANPETLRQRVAALPEPVEVAVSVTVSAHRVRPAA